jgi:hypothetical protein
LPHPAAPLPRRGNFAPPGTLKNRFFLDKTALAPIFEALKPALGIAATIAVGFFPTEEQHLLNLIRDAGPDGVTSRPLRDACRAMRRALDNNTWQAVTA